MGKKPRKVLQGIVNHCYQRTVDGRLIFYTVSDYLLYYTISCVTSAKYQIRILKLVIMPDHIHLAVIEEKKGDMYKYIKACHSRFAREHNRLCHTRGQLFEHSFGSACKYYDKYVRVTMLYLDNNPVERQLAEKAEDYRWNFLAYGASDHPFSDPILLRLASGYLRRAMKQVTLLHEQGRFLPYPMLQRLFRSLPNDTERRQLVDFIIVTYSFIEHQTAIGYFGSYEAELIAAHAGAGREHDLNEVFNGKSDAHYQVMMRVLKKEGRYKRDIHEIFALSATERQSLFQLLRRKTSAPDKQIAAFLRL